MSTDLHLNDLTSTSASPLDHVPQSPTPITSDIENRQASEGYVEALPPVDRGKDAWLFVFLLGAGVLEFFIWGWPTCVGILRVYWLNHIFGGREESTITLAATLQSGLLYLGVGIVAP